MHRSFMLLLAVSAPLLLGSCGESNPVVGKWAVDVESTSEAIGSRSVLGPLARRAFGSVDWSGCSLEILDDGTALGIAAFRDVQQRIQGTWTFEEERLQLIATAPAELVGRLTVEPGMLDEEGRLSLTVVSAGVRVPVILIRD